MTQLRMHVALNVKDLDANLDFYQKFFGAEPTKVKENYAKFELQNPPLHFSLNVRPYETRGVLNHLGFQVEGTQAVLEHKARLQASGLVSLDEMNTTCCYAVQDKIWVRDPEGNAWEIFYTSADAEFESAKEPVAEGVCCVVSPATETATTTETSQSTASTCCTATATVSVTSQSSTGGCGCGA